MKQILKKLYKAIRGDSLYRKASFSQEGEDLLVERIVGVRETAGTYLDVGAHDPVKFSNTYLFYKKGWSGLNIEAAKGSKALFDRKRPRDTNVEVPVSDAREKITYYMFNCPELNSFSREHADEWDGKDGVKLVGTEEMETVPLMEILEEHYPEGHEFTFMTIDVEGMDLRILKSIDFDRYRSKLILVEDNVRSVEGVADAEIYQFLSGKGYEMISKLVYTKVYRKKED